MNQGDQSAAITKKPTKKEAEKEVFEKLSNALAEYKDGVKEKKFKRKLKKASKLFAVDIARSLKKNRKRALAGMEVVA
ncbi:MAG: hypothetical protein M3015_15025 [Bacteroidota bacterium]|nr:hypothetical protein [Bacteroidota bacterium]